MNIYFPSLKRATSLLLISASLLVSACATPAKPRILQDASDRIESTETAEIEDLQPRLIREAKQYEIKARQAYERRDLEQAKLYAHLAVQRYDTARNLIQRDASEQLSTLMASANEDLKQEEQKLAAEQREVARYEELAERFNSVKGELAQVREDQQGAAAQARRLLLQARSRQAEALGAGASMVEPKEYAEARLEVENALEAYDSELFDESSSASQRAIASFEQLIETAQESAKARRQQEQELLAKQQERKVQLGEAQQKAQAAIDEATEAQTTAIGARMPQENQALYQQGVFLLESAERRFRDNDFDGSVRKSNDARDIFLSASRDENIATDTVALGPDNTQTTGAQAPANQEVINAIQRAEDARGAALARGASLSDMQRGDYALELARQARDRQESSRAIQKASEAAALYEGLGSSQLNTVAAAPAATDASASYATGSSKGLRKLAEEQIVKLQLERAEALGALKDQECPGSFREFEAVLELAQQRYDAKDYAQSFEFSVRASERLKKCDVTTQVEAAKKEASSAASRRASSEERAEQEARDSAATALSLAQGDYAVLQATGAPDDESLKEPAILIATAERWFNQRAYPQAEALAKRAISSMDEIKKQRAEEMGTPTTSTTAVASTAPEVKEVTTATTTAKSPEELAKEARHQEVCREVDALIEQVKGAQLRASNTELDESEEARYKRAIRTLNRAQDLRRDDNCESSQLLAEESLASFEEIVKSSKTEPATASTTSEPQTVVIRTESGTSQQPAENRTTKTDTSAQDSAAQRALNEQKAADASSAIAAAKLAKAQVQSQSKNNVYTTANSLLTEAQRAADSGEYARAEGLATQATGAFKSLDANAGPVTTANGETVDPSWKPAYSKVLDALIRRDEVKPMISDAEQPIFDRGVQNLERSRRSWDSRDFMAAGRFADAAKSDFNKAADAVTARKAEEDRLRKERIAKENAEQRAQRIKEEKAAAEAKAKADQEAAAKAAADQAAADKAAQDAQVQQRRAADDIIREGLIKKDLCDKQMCSLRDEASLVRADETLASAQKSFELKDYVRAEELGRAALKTYETVLAKPRSFAITSKVTRVTQAGNRLILNPKVKFESGTTTIVSESLASVDELAQVLRENESTLKSVKLVGYTDSRGNDKTNLKLSQERAAAVMKALTDRGVKQDLISSEGRGEADPVATNKTADGRELNRRVEVVIVTTKGE